jgi:5'-nucleotidase/UDP-sugar diphosphatase
MRRLAGILLLFFLAASGETAQTAAIIYTGNANGYLECCNCPGNPYGGLSRRMSSVNALRTQYSESLLVDTGDTLPLRNDALLARYCFKMIDAIGYDFVIPGEQDVIAEKEALPCYYHPPFYLPCNFSLNKEQYSIKSINGVRLALLGAIDVKIPLLLSSNQEMGESITALKQILPSIRKKADIIVLVAHMNSDEAVHVADNVPGIDVIITGHAPGFNSLLRHHSTIIVSSDDKGQRIGILKILFNNNKKITSYTNEFVLLDNTVADAPKALEIIDKYKEELKARAKQLLNQ